MEHGLPVFDGAELAVAKALQDFVRIIKMGSEQGEFIVDAYPVSLRVTDLIVTFFTVIIAGNIATWYPVKYLSRRLVK